MTDPKYAPTTAHDALVRISEECHELGKVACKALRFGINDTHPKRGKTNMDLLHEELADVNFAVAEYLRLYELEKDIPASCLKCGWIGVRNDFKTWEYHEGEEGYSRGGENCVFKCPDCMEDIQ